MPDTVRIPLAGNIPKKGLIFGGIAGVGVLGYVWWKHKTTGDAATASSYAYGYGYGVSPYGYGYGTPAGGTGYYGYGFGYGSYGYGGAFGYGIPGGNPPIPSGTGNIPSSGPKTNGEWTRQTVPMLVAAGRTRSTSTLALSRYVRGIPVTSEEGEIVTEAIGLNDQPPVPGKNGYPPKIHRRPPGGQTQRHPKPPKAKATVIANGHQTVWQIAHANNDTEATVIALNLNLARYVGTHHPVPKGTRVKV